MAILHLNLGSSIRAKVKVGGDNCRGTSKARRAAAEALRVKVRVGFLGRVQ